MSGRIRTIKPEWLDDEVLALCSSDARVLSIALITLADDYGNGRASILMLAGRVFPGQPREILASAIEDLVTARYIVLYEVDGQHYFSIRNWTKHQKVDHPGKPKVPKPHDNLDSRKTLANLTENLANPRASRDPFPSLPGPCPGPEASVDLESKLPCSLDDALKLVVHERARVCEDHEERAEWIQPDQWPEVIQAAATFGEARGLPPPRLGVWRRDAGVRALVGLFADGHPLDDVLEACRRSATDSWFVSKKAGLSSLTPEVVRRLLSGPVTPINQPKPEIKPQWV